MHTMDDDAQSSCIVLVQAVLGLMSGRLQTGYCAPVLVLHRQPSTGSAFKQPNLQLESFGDGSSSSSKPCGP